MFVNYGDVDFFEYGVLVESDSLCFEKQTKQYKITVL